MVDTETEMKKKSRPADESDHGEKLPDSTSISELLSELRSGVRLVFFLCCGDESNS